MDQANDSQPTTCDKQIVGGDKITTGNISDSNAVAIGAGAVALFQSFGAEPEEPVPFSTLLLYLQKASEDARPIGQEPAIKQLYEMPMRVQVIYPLQQSELLRLACARLPENMTAADWVRYCPDQEYRCTRADLPLHPSVLNSSTLTIDAESCPLLPDGGES